MIKKIIKLHNKLVIKLALSFLKQIILKWKN